MIGFLVGLRRGALLALPVLFLACADGTASPPSSADAPVPVDEAVAAAARGDADWLRGWIAKGGNPDQADARGWTPLLMASARGKAAAVDALLNNPVRKADPGVRFAPSGALPIHMAGQSGDVGTAKVLLDARPDDVNAVWLLNGHTLLLQAAFYGRVGLAEFALSRGADPAATSLRGLTALDLARQFDNRPLADALAKSPPTQVAKEAWYQALLEKIRVPVPPGEEESQRRSDDAAAAISEAIRLAGDSPERVDELVAGVVAKLEGVDANRLAGALRQPLLVVAVTGNNPGAHPDAAASARLQIVRALLDRGASPLAKEEHPMGAQAVIRASVFGHVDILRLMGARMTAAELAGALNEIPAVNGLTALHDAVLRAGTASDDRLPRYLEQIRWEVGSGARTDIGDFSGRTQRQYAEEIADPDRRETVLAALNSAIPMPQWNHPAIAVAALEPAMQWYSDVFGFEPLTPPAVHTPAIGDRWKIAESIFGDDITQVRFVRMRVPDAPFKQVVELFEIQPPPPPPDPEQKRRSGYVHACLIVGDPDTTAARISARGGKILSRAVMKDLTIVFCRDPYGNIIELASGLW
jgi:ankyrin repeat protein/catechol 2,3-dioxygenase-like lactoylglutathione lyase family enzyme